MSDLVAPDDPAFRWVLIRGNRYQMHNDIANEIERLRGLLKDCSEHFKTLREANVFVWPHHPLNPEARIGEALKVEKGS